MAVWVNRALLLNPVRGRANGKDFGVQSTTVLRRKVSRVRNGNVLVTRAEILRFNEIFGASVVGLVRALGLKLGCIGEIARHDVNVLGRRFGLESILVLGL